MLQGQTHAFPWKARHRRMHRKENRKRSQAAVGKHNKLNCYLCGKQEEAGRQFRHTRTSARVRLLQTLKHKCANTNTNTSSTGRCSPSECTYFLMLWLLGMAVSAAAFPFWPLHLHTGTNDLARKVNQVPDLHCYISPPRNAGVIWLVSRSSFNLACSSSAYHSSCLCLRKNSTHPRNKSSRLAGF